MTPDEAVGAIQRAARRVAPSELFAAAVSDGVMLPGTKLGNAALADVYADGDALLAAVSKGEQGAISAAMRGLARLDGELVVEAALAFANGGKGELRRAGMFALARSHGEHALGVLLEALEPGSQVPRAALERSVHADMAVRVRSVLVETGLTVFAVRPRPNLEEWRALSPDERRELDAMQPPGPPTVELQRACNAVSVLGARNDLASLDLILRMFASHPDDRLRLRCAHALAAISDPRAHAALDARWADADSTIATIAVRAAVQRDVATAWTRFEPHLTAVTEGPATQTDEAIVSTLLYIIHGGVSPRKVRREVDPLVVEPRFLDLAARLRHHETIDAAARLVLEVVSREQAVAAIERHPRQPRTLALIALPERRDFLARYEAGNHMVWDELVGLAPAISQHPDLREEAGAVARALMKRVRHNADVVQQTLRDSGARVGNDDPPATGTELDRLISIIGPLPLALEAFFRIVGSISLRPGGEDRYRYGPTTLEADGLSLLALDPLEVYGPDLRALLDDYEAQIKDSHREIVGPLTLDLSPDVLHKQDISGGPPYSIELPPRTFEDAVDPFVHNERHRTTLVGYLRVAFAWGGFPDLAIASLHPDDIHINDREAFKHVKGSWREAADRLRAKLCRDLIAF